MTVTLGKRGSEQNQNGLRKPGAVPMNGERLERVQLMLSRELSEWLDRLSVEIREKTGAAVSRSEITRAALATLREVHRLGVDGWDLAGCRSGADLTVAGVATVRRAAQRS